MNTTQKDLQNGKQINATVPFNSKLFLVEVLESKPDLFVYNIDDCLYQVFFGRL